MEKTSEKPPLDERQLFDNAWKLKRKGLLQESFDAYKAVVKQFPNTVEARYAKSQIEMITREIAKKGRSDRDPKLDQAEIKNKSPVSMKTILFAFLLFIVIVGIPTGVLFFLVGWEAIAMTIAIMILAFACPLMYFLYAPVLASIGLAESGAPVSISGFFGEMCSELNKGITQMRRKG